MVHVRRICQYGIGMFAGSFEGEIDGFLFVVYGRIGLGRHDNVNHVERDYFEDKMTPHPDFDAGFKQFKRRLWCPKCETEQEAMFVREYGQSDILNERDRLCQCGQEMEMQIDD